MFVVFFLAPIALVLWVSFTDWNGTTNPLEPGGARFVGTDNFTALLADDGLLREEFAISLRNTLVRADRRAGGDRAGVRAGAGGQQPGPARPGLLPDRLLLPVGDELGGDQHHLPVPVLRVGVVNALLARVGVDGPSWFTDPRGVLHLLLDGLGVVDSDTPPGWASGTSVLGLSLWEWLAGPSVALVALLALTTWASSGTFMLFFLAGLQNIPPELDEAAAIDGASTWQRFRYVTLPPDAAHGAARALHDHRGAHGGPALDHAGAGRMIQEARPAWQRVGFRAGAYGLLALAVLLYLGPFLLQIVTSSTAPDRPGGCGAWSGRR